MPSLASKLENIRDQIICGASQNELIADVESALSQARKVEGQKVTKRGLLSSIFKS